MNKRYIFHYDEKFPDVDKEANETLKAHDGMECEADINDIGVNELVNIFFDDGNEFNAFVYELEEVVMQNAVH